MKKKQSTRSVSIATAQNLGLLPEEFDKIREILGLTLSSQKNHS